MTTTQITTKEINGRIELSIPRIPGVRSELMAIVSMNAERWIVMKARRDIDGEISVYHCKNGRTYKTQDRALFEAEKFLACEIARTES